MFNVDLVGGGMRQLPSGVRERRIPPLGGSCGGWPQARALLKPATVILRAAAFLRTAAGSSGAALAGTAALFSAA